MINLGSDKFRRFALILVTMFVLSAPLMFTGTASAASGSIFFSPASGSLTVGNIITINVKENSGEDEVNVAMATIVYSIDKLEFVDIVSSPAFSIPVPAPNTAGIIKVAKAALQPVTGTQTIASVRFKVLSAGTTTISFDSETFLAMKEVLVTDSSIDGTYVLKEAPVSSSTSGSKPSSTSRPGSSRNFSKDSNKITDPKVFFKNCDFNRSDYVDIFDLTILLNNYNKKWKGVDINKDGSINTIDLSVMLSNYGR